MKRLDDLKLSKNAKKEVKTWMEEYIEMFKKNADGREGNCKRNDFENNDVFFFTDCTDLINKESPDGGGNENDLEIRRRKRNVEKQLLFKYMLGEDINVTTKCTHCGGTDRFLDGTEYGAFHYCPDCGMVSANLHPGDYINGVEAIMKYLHGCGFKKHLLGIDEYYIKLRNRKKRWKLW